MTDHSLHATRLGLHAGRVDRTSTRTRPAGRVVRTCLIAAALGAPLLLGACSVTPWVKPYEREHFADPIMSLDRDPVAAVYFDHVLESREGSRGATGTVGGGCGCN